MTHADRLMIINRLTMAQPEDLDALLGSYCTNRRPLGTDIAPCPEPGFLPAPQLARQDAVAVGVLVTAPLQDPSEVAFRLGALAVEQDVEVIVLTTLDYSGLERFGFRTERIVGETDAERAACRAQLEQFWGIELTLPAHPSTQPKPV